MERIAYRLAGASAMLGGIVLTFLILMTCASIIGRALIPIGLAPITGDFELVEAGIAFTIFAFLPLCQINAGHATVDIFTLGLGERTNRWLLAFWEVIFTLALILITWRLYEGMLGKVKNGEFSMLLQFKTWWAYAACMVPAVIGVLVGLWSSWDRVRAALTGRDTRPVFAGASH